MPPTHKPPERYFNILQSLEELQIAAAKKILLEGTYSQGDLFELIFSGGMIALQANQDPQDLALCLADASALIIRVAELEIEKEKKEKDSNETV